MRFNSFTHWTIATGAALLTAACTPAANIYAGPGCRVDLYTLPNMQGYELPVMRDTPEVAIAWHNTAVSARVIYGTWRLFTDPDYKGFMGDYKAPVDVPQLVPMRAVNSLKCLTPEPVLHRY
jgi:hypothetical protein